MTRDRSGREPDDRSELLWIVGLARSYGYGIALPEYGPNGPSDDELVNLDQQMVEVLLYRARQHFKIRSDFDQPNDITKRSG